MRSYLVLLSGRFSRAALALAVLSACVLAACGGSSQPASVKFVPVVKKDLAKPKTTYEGRTFIVREGDNLYSISFAAGENYLEVARWNNIQGEDYTIHPDQVIKLYPPESEASGTARSSTKSSDSSAGATSRVQPSSGGTRVATGAPAKSGWSWPASGEIIQSYSESANVNGIQIGGDLGQPVHAALDGEVVYAGSGLPGYGRMIIVKHDARHLSAYAHNSRLVVQEGSTVRRGQKIAEMGRSDADRVKLHFEIRVDGRPVNPVRFLPKV